MNTNDHEPILLLKASDCRSGVSAERRQIEEMRECGFLPEAATPAMQNLFSVNSCLFVSIRG
jgi:hypothetical protein